MGECEDANYIGVKTYKGMHRTCEYLPRNGESHDLCSLRVNGYNQMAVIGDTY